MRTPRAYLLLLALIPLMAGCFDPRGIHNVEVEPISPTWGVAVANSSLTIAEMLETLDTLARVEADPDTRVVSLLFTHRTEIPLDLEQFFIPDKTFTQIIPVAPLLLNIYHEDYTTIENESEIKSVDLSGGELIVTFRRDFTNPCQVSLELHSLRPPGLAPTELMVVTPDWGANPNLSVQRINLAGTRMNLSAVVGGVTVYNIFRYAIRFQSDGTFGGSLRVDFEFRDLQFSRMIGLINYTQEYDPQRIDLSAFDSIVRGRMFMANPIFNFSTTSSYGVPSAFVLDSLVFRSASGARQPVENRGPLTPADLQIAPALNYIAPAPTPGSSSSTTLSLNRDNSNLPDALLISPNAGEFFGRLRLGVAPAPIPNPHDGFVLDTSSLNIDVETRIPLVGWIDSLTFRSESQVQLPSLEEVEMIDDYTVLTRLKTTNGLPLAFALQAEFIDSLGQSLGYLFEDADDMPFIASPPIDAQGNPIGTLETLTDIPLPRARYDQISRARTMVFILRLDTGGPDNPKPNVSIRDTQELRVQLAVRLNPTIRIDL